MPLNYLPVIKSPEQIRSLSPQELTELTAELRQYIIETVTEIGGHLASTLGVIELTVALHYIYQTPRDKLVWDVGHQAYAHKVLTGRFEKLKTIRQMGGLSGFLKRSESEYDVFGAGHASTSISAALGIAAARDQKNEDFKVVAIIGDGAMTGGLAYEGLNNAGQLRKQLLVVLNDNDMSISPNVGAIHTHLTKIVTNPLYNRIRDDIWRMTGMLPIGKSMARTFIKKIEESLKNLIVPGIIFDELGFRYFGPIDGHNLEELITTLHNIKNIQTPVLLHVVTKKGKGMKVAEDDPVTFHGVKGRPSANASHSPQVKERSFQDVFGALMCEVAKNRNDTVAITAAMREGTGLVPFARQFPQRYFDVGIAEGHAVTFASGMVTEGIRPVVAIYSTFLQRAFDHIIHDASIQSLPVVFCLDRAGIAGEDGPTHHGVLDIAYLRCIQNMVVAAPANGNEFRHLLYTALNQNKTPFAIRYPKASSVEFDDNGQAELIPIGQWQVQRTGRDAVVLCVGPMVYEGLKAAEELSLSGTEVEVVNSRFIKPMDTEYLADMMKRFSRVVTIEEGTVVGGFGQGVTSWLAEHDFSGQIRTLAIPDRMIEHGPRNRLLEKLNLTSQGIINAIRDMKA